MTKANKPRAIDCSRLTPSWHLLVCAPVVIPCLRAGTCCAVLRGSLLIVWYFAFTIKKISILGKKILVIMNVYC